MRISDWSSDVCSSDLTGIGHVGLRGFPPQQIGMACEGEPALDAMIDPGAVLQAEEALGRALAGEEFVIALVDVRGDELGAFGVGARDHQRRHPRHRSEEHTSELQSLMRISYAVFCLKK